MQVPVIRGLIDRRVLVNYRVDPQVLSSILPPPFEPKLINGFGMGGICLIRLKQIRPRYLPLKVGFSSENAAHRFAVQWMTEGVLREGVFIPRRDTSSKINAFVGGRFFPGIHHHAHFDIYEQIHRYRIELRDDNMDLRLAVDAETANSFPNTSVFSSIEEASRFFESGSLGYSVTTNYNEFDGLELQSFNWKVEPLDVSYVYSDFFEDDKLFPKESSQFDCALLMRQIEHEWHARESLNIDSG